MSVKNLGESGFSHRAILRSIEEVQKIAPSNFVLASRFGFATSASGTTNAKALKEAIRLAENRGWPVLIDNAPTRYIIEGDIWLVSDNLILMSLGYASLQFNNGGLRIGGTGVGAPIKTGVGLHNLVLNRGGTPGPVIKVLNTNADITTRQTWTNIRSTTSTGDFLNFEGGLLTTIEGLWVANATGNAITCVSGAWGIGANVVSIYGGELYNCGGWGLDLTATRSFQLHSVTIENNGQGGIWLRGQNKAFLMSGGDFESNGQDVNHTGSNDELCSVSIGDSSWGGQPNRCCTFDTVFFSRGVIATQNHCFHIQDGHESIQIRNPHFVRFINKPIKFASGASNTTTGKVDGGVNLDSNYDAIAGSFLSDDTSAFAEI